jgi:hypothetical protein
MLVSVRLRRVLRGISQEKRETTSNAALLAELA